MQAPLSTTMRMAAALQQAGRHFELLLMPGQGHSPDGPFEQYVLDDVVMFLDRTLRGRR